MHKAKELSLAGAATSIFVATKTSFYEKNYVTTNICCRKAQIFLPRQIFLVTKVYVATSIILSRLFFFFLATSILLSRDTSGSCRQ